MSLSRHITDSVDQRVVTDLETRDGDIIDNVVFPDDFDADNDGYTNIEEHLYYFATGGDAATPVCSITAPTAEPSYNNGGEPASPPRTAPVKPDMIKSL